MAVKFIFEDKETTPSSKLLLSSYNGNNIYFSGGCHSALDKALEIQESDDIIYIFYDMSPNNNFTVKGYRDINRLIKKSNLKNIYIIPIICIEYFICKLLDKLELLQTTKDIEDLIQNLIKVFDWNAITYKHKLDSYIGSSLEHAYKYIVSHQPMQCLHNSFKYNTASKDRNLNSISGVFYEKDCNCNRRYCKPNCIISLKDKAELLYTMLPLFTIVSEDHVNLMKNLNIQTVYMENQKLEVILQKFYDNISTSINCNSVQISI